MFEGQRAYSGEIFQLTEHSERLRKSARMLGFEIPWSVDEIDAACNEVLKANELVDAYMRPVAWRGSEQMGVSAQGTKPHLAIAAGNGANISIPRAGRQGHPARHRAAGGGRRPTPRRCIARRPGLYMICTLARQHAEAAAIDDALMFDWRGQVAEATGANAFFVKDGELHTPTPDCFLDGITRQTVMDLARSRGIEVIERAIWPEELESFEQMFITGTAAEVTLRRLGRPVEFRGRRPVAPARQGL